MSERRIAAFDFDGTISRGTPCCRSSHGLWGADLLAGDGEGGTAGRSGPHRAPRGGGAPPRRLEGGAPARAARRREAAWLAREGRRYAQTLVAKLRPEMVEQIAWHRNAGHELVIVSAGLQAYLEPFAEAHGFDHVIAVELEEGQTGRLTGELVGPNVRGPEKAVRFRRWLGGDEPSMLWAYGNSSGDRELLALADVPVWVTGSKRATTARPMVGAGGRARAVEPQRSEGRAPHRSLGLHADAGVDADRLGVHVAVAQELHPPAQRTPPTRPGAWGRARLRRGGP